MARVEIVIEDHPDGGATLRGTPSASELNALLQNPETLTQAQGYAIAMYAAALQLNRDCQDKQACLRVH